ncbi:polymorphic toxin-type HINT domain-containing protein, partial [Streptomyces sp. NPDC055055]
VGGTNDPDTGLTHLGAREYDPAIGRFISVDPILDLNDPQQSQGYSYGNNNPVSFSDPTGLRPDGPVGGADYNDKRETTGAGHYNGSTGSGWFKDNYGGWSYRYKQNISTFTANQVIWSDRATSKGRGKSTKMTFIDNPPPPVTFYERYIGPVIGSLILPDFEAWSDCIGDGPWSQCGWAATDIPIAKPLKALKLLKGVKAGERVEEAAETAAKVCGVKHSFLAGTKVLLADGSSKNIENVAVGDTVLATDPDTGETRGRKVLDTIVTQDDKEFTELTVKTAAGTSKIVATDTHPFWSVNLDQWVEAGDVLPGTALRTPKGEAVDVVAARHYVKRQLTYDLTVHGIHTYYVSVGGEHVLVHNSDGGGLSAAERQILQQAQSIMNSPEFAKIRQAHAAGVFTEISVGGVGVLYEPGLPSSGFTLFSENSFVMGPVAFQSEAETAKTLLHESHRLATSKVAGGVSAGLVSSETDGAFDFANKAYESWEC